MEVITTMRFLEYGMPAPKNSGFKGIITGEAVFGHKGWMSYTARKDAVDPMGNFDHGGDEGSYFRYEGREAAVSGATMSSYGFLNTDEKRDVFREACRQSFSKDGDLIWDVVIALKDYETAGKCGLKNQENYGAFINTTLVSFFKRVGMDPMNVLWWEDYHSNTEHPHMHVCFLEKQQTRDKGRFTAKELRQLKYCIAKELTVREQQQNKISEVYSSDFRKKDQERAEVLSFMKKVDPAKMDGIDDLIRYLPRQGRMQYGAYQMAPFRAAIDQITDKLLDSEELQGPYQAYLRYLDGLERNVDAKAGTHVATIKETELRQLHVDIGNIILKYVKEIRLSNKSTRTGYQYMSNELESFEGAAANRMSRAEGKEWREYKRIRDEFYETSSMPAGSGKKEKMQEILHSMEEMALNVKSKEVGGLLDGRLALNYLYGRNVDKDIDKAKAYARSAVDAGSVRAYSILAKSCFAKGESLEGMEALYLGKLNGDPTSTFMWGLQMISGKNCPKDRTAGFEAIITSAELGCIPALNYVRTHKSMAFVKTVEGVVIHRISHSLGGMTAGGEVASFINNSDQLHSYSGQLEREIDAYLNNRNSIEQKRM